jgi:hypothetical protein
LKGFRVLYIAMVFLVVFSVIGVASENRPEYGGTLTIGMPVAPQGWFNPLISSSKYDQDVIKHIFNGLLEIGPDMEYIPSLAERWEFSEDGLEWTFYLRDDVRWHDGKAFTTKDVNFTFTMLLHPKYFGGKGADFIFIEGAREFKSGEAQFVSGIQVIDDYTIKFRLTESFAPFMESMTFPILPEHLLKDVPVAELDKASFNLHPVGTGPYKLQRYVNGQYVELKVNDLYFAVVINSSSITSNRPDRVYRKNPQMFIKLKTEEGKNKCLKRSKKEKSCPAVLIPPTGNHSNRPEKIYIANIPRKKPGTDRPAKVRNVRNESRREYGLIAEITASKRPTDTEIIKEVPISKRVAGTRSIITSSTGRPRNIDQPNFPRKSPLTHLKYWIYNG